MFVPDISPFNSEPRKERPRTQEDGLIKEFLTKPYALPVWLWNIFVIGLYLSVIVFVLQIAAIVVVGGLSLFLNGSLQG